MATCGNFSVLWNFSDIRKTKASDSVSHGGLVTCTTYNIIPKDESVVDSVFMHEKYAGDHHESSLVVATRSYLWALNGDDDEE